MDSLEDRLPGRFPVGTRYVVEGRGGSRGQLRICLRFLELPDGRHIDLPVDPAARSRPRGRRSGRPASARK